MNGWNYVIILLIKRTEEWGAAALPITRLPAPLANCLCPPFPSWPPWILAHTLQMGKVPSAPCPQTARLNYVTSSFRTFPDNFLSLFQGSPHRTSSSCRSAPHPYALIASSQSSKVVQDQLWFLSSADRERPMLFTWKVWSGWEITSLLQPLSVGIKCVSWSRQNLWVGTSQCSCVCVVACAHMCTYM